MRKVIFLPILLMTFYCFGQSQIIGVPIKLSNIEVAQFNFPNMMTRSQAINACRELGFGWELPTKIQLDSLYKNKIIIGGFNNDIYWSSSLNDNGKGWSQNFSNGNKGFSDYEVLGYVRAIKELVNDADFEEFLKESDKIIIQSSGVKVSADNFSKGIPFASTINTASDKRHYTDSELKEANKAENIIGKPIKIGKLLVAQNEFPKKSDWSNAKAMCLKLGPGWRLPTKDELYILYQNKNVLRNFSKYGYWSSTEGIMNGNNGVAYYQDFTLGSTKPILENKLSTWGVRAVKSL